MRKGLLTKDAPLGTLVKDAGFAIKTESLKDDGSFEGYGSIFGNVDSHGEIVEPGAFTASLVANRRAGRSVKMLFQHDPSQPIGVWSDLAEDSKGLWGAGKLLVADVPRAKEVHALLKAGAVEGLSIGYREVQTAPDKDKPGIRRLQKLDLREISVVTFPANERARVENVKHIIAAGTMPTVREFEELLRDAGFSKAKAAAIASEAKAHLRGDPDVKADDPSLALLRALAI